MVEIIPAVLPHTVHELEEGLAHLVGVASFVQVDVVDSHMLAGLDAMPLWEQLDFEFDLMVDDPAGEVDACVALGASRIVVHAENRTAKVALEKLQPLRDGNFAVAAGLALRAHDEPQMLDEFRGLFDYVQVMGIDRIGAQGEPPDPHKKEVGLLRALRAAHPELVLQVDGAAAAHVRELVDAGADRLVVGSAIARAEDARSAYKMIYREANAQ